MAPTCVTFPAKDVHLHVQVGPDGRVRKTEGGLLIDLADCELFGLVQYECSIDHPEIRDSKVRCWPVQRWFRRCQDRKGKFTVETTAWEGTAAASAGNTTTTTTTLAAAGSQSDDQKSKQSNSKSI
ncbi:hypothetical protein B0H66DRAFT_310261 [Apodospora peruviana]|uniref:Uncharacterized protein n=1 Tax=Apodospora peruviana TaxID=516989 RepID=A0AAE0I1Z4_9PEZI|nr:hypothetical protein B0H66DRAFT_310261 [Apodospora peruviana]